jgi:hypothetical protein
MKRCDIFNPKVEQLIMSTKVDCNIDNWKNYNIDCKILHDLDWFIFSNDINIFTTNMSIISEVEHYCRNNYEELGFEKDFECVNYCYYCPECSSEYVFRQVNNYNPFPRSSDSNTLGYNYPTGDRVIGSNWLGKSQYIKADDEDSSSVTGVQKNQNVEYVIELTPNDVRAIRKDTEDYNKTTQGNDAYLDYVYMKNVDTHKRYYSKFVNETFYYTFTMVNGEIAN